MSLSVEHANIAWMLLTAALVMLMQGGFCCLESGLARAKNSINVAIKNLSDFCVSSVLFWLCGFGLMFGNDWHGLFGTSSFLLSGQETPWLLAFFLFQLVFCGTSTTIVSGAVAERMKFSGYLIVSAVISGLIYPIFGHWAWGGVVSGTGQGWLAARGFIDFAGSTVVHSVGGWVALVAVILIRPRLGRFDKSFHKIHGHNYPLATLGTMLLWFGWFGFNGGSTLALNDSIPLILVNTNLAAGAGGITTLFLSWWIKKRADVGDIMNGVISGLVGITASCHIMTPGMAIVIGAVSGIVCLATAAALEWLHIDDVIGAIPVHGFCGAWGTLAVALLADPARFGTGLDFWGQLQVQATGVAVCMAWSCGVTLLLVGGLSLFYNLRVDPEAEKQGLNISEHGASTELIDLLSDMRRQSQDADFSRLVEVEPHTEVGQIASEYNKVLHKVVGEIERREDLVSQLREAEEKYRSIFENATEGIFRCTLDSRFLDVNPALAKTLGFSNPLEVLAEVRNIRDELYVDPLSRDRLMSLLKENEAVTGFETSLRRRDGSIVEVSINARQAHDPMTGETCVEGSLCDISQRRQAERFRQEKEAAESASRAKSAFLATMSHEIRTPLNGVIGMLELLSNSDLSRKQNHYTSIAKSSAQALLSLINDILDFSKIEAGKLELGRSDFDLLMLLEDITDMFGHRAEQKQLELSCHVFPQVPVRVIGDAERVRQILINLVGNALKFTERGEVRIRAQVTATSGSRQTVRFEVEDTGVGIPEEIQNRLFQVFEQADSSTTRKYGGTGLGLAICRQLIELMEGRVGVESQVGHGSLFWCEIPFEVVSACSVRGGGDRRMHGLRVLAVDDNWTNLEILETQLTSWQANVTTACHGLQALRLLDEAAEPFDLIILDHQMPELDGIELARRMRGHAKLNGAPLIMLTSSDSPCGSEALRELGILACCTKPIIQSRLYDVLVTALHTPDRGTVNGSAIAIEPAAARQMPVVECTGRRVLIADDNEINQMVTQEILEKAGFQCRVAGNGQEVIDLLRRRYFDLVLMDCQMPVMDGFTATRQVRQMQAAGELPAILPSPLSIIALTANAVLGDRERCLEAGMTDYVTKPVDPRQLLNVIRQHLPKSPPPSSSPADSTILVPSDVSEDAEVNLPEVDWSALQDRCGGDRAFARRVVEKFSHRLDGDLRRIEAAWQQHDVEESRRLAHALKGAAASVAANGVSQSAAAIESLAKSATTDEIPGHLDELRRRIQDCIAFIEKNAESALG